MAKTELKPIDITRYTITENGNVIRSKTTNEELKEQDIRLNKLCFDYQEKEKRIAELEAQIEKMKCGQNCKHSYLYQEDRKCSFTYCDCINCKDKWELAE